jgi:N-acetylated-alpha-linked acidic dipeptidase
MANADVLPFDVNCFYKTLVDYVAEVKALQDNSRTETEQENKMIREKLFDTAKDPKKNYLSPKIKTEVPFLDFSSIENAMTQLKKSTEELKGKYEGAIKLQAPAQTELNNILFKLERSLLNEKGLPGRAWYKHQVYAPGYYTGYGVKTLPGIREAIEQRNWKEAQENIAIVANTIANYQQKVQEALNILK